MPTDYEGIAAGEAQKRRLQDAFDLGMDQIRLQKQTAGISHGDQLAKLRRSATRTYPHFQGGFAHRGLMNSGIYKEKFSDRMTEQAASEDVLNKNFWMTVLGLNAAEQGLNRQLWTGVSDATNMQNARQQALAEQLQL